MASVKLLPNREKSIRHRHPWVYSGAVAGVDGAPGAGAVVDVRDAAGNFMGRGYYNAASKLRVRMLTWDDRVVDDAFWRERVGAAVRRRAALLDARHNAVRLIHAEADGLPGLVVDRYDDVLVAQFLTAGVDRVRDVIADALVDETGARCVFERSDTASRSREELTASVGAMRGEAPDAVNIVENGARFRVNVTTGQKTGFYLDQRANRADVAARAGGKSLLDAFCNTGAFGIEALAAGAASVTFVDSSAPALEILSANLALNGLDAAATDVRQADVFNALRGLRDEKRTFDMVVLDPPRFATNRHQLDKALRAYKDVNRVAMELVAPGGMLATFSCSQAVDPAAFTLAVSWAGADARREVRIARRYGQFEDHPVLASFPESEYLCGLLCTLD
jgi:23S rRNA (cytosine1962-C5)-methyltransferase